MERDNKEILGNIIKAQNIAHSYMFIRTDEQENLRVAKEFAKSILCLNKNENCDNCKSCLEFNNYNHPDFNIIEPEKNSIKIEQIREIIKKILEKPIVSLKKVYIINHSDLMTREAQNSLLKTLEEPPEYAVIILTAKNENMFLDTIKSRCIKMSFYKTEERESKEDYKEVDKIFLNLENINIIDLIIFKDIIFNKENATDVLEHINNILFNLLNDNGNKKNRYIKCIELVEETKRKLSKNNNFDMTIDNFIIKIWEEING